MSDKEFPEFFAYETLAVPLDAAKELGMVAELVACSLCGRAVERPKHVVGDVLCDTCLEVSADLAGKV